MSLRMPSLSLPLSAEGDSGGGLSSYFAPISSKEGPVIAKVVPRAFVI